jgi:membrane dipeptidase
MKYFLYAFIVPFLASCISNESIKEKALKLRTKIVTVDTHCDTPMQFTDKSFDIGEEHKAPDSRVDLPRMKKGGLDAIFFAVFTSQGKRDEEGDKKVYTLANRILDSIYVEVDRNKETAGLAFTPEDVVKLKKEGKRAIYIGMENGYPVGTDLSRVQHFYDRGVRYITLCHSSNNDICDSSTDRKGPEHNGLSKFGRKVVKKMNELGMIIDVSHISDKSFYDVIELSDAPVIASHSSVRAICDHPRNMTDDMIKKLAAKGGVIQICLLGNYIREADTTSMNYIKKQELKKKYNGYQFSSDVERDSAWAEYRRINKQFPPKLPTIADAVDHIGHVVNVVGIDYVGIGSDFDGGGGLADCKDVSDYPKITEELLRREYTEEEIAKIWGGNFLRVFKEIEKKKSS